MKHVDEGTVHAWIDGALPPDERARIESHIASCKSCSALVAEARGLIAASSRILSALDDVPAGVVPAVTGRAGLRADEKRAQAPNTSREAAGASAAHLPSSVSHANRVWWQRPQFAAAAAMAFIAAGAVAAVRINSGATMADFAAPAAEQRSASAPIAPAAPAQDLARSAVQPPAATPAPAENRIEPRRVGAVANAAAPAADLSAKARAASEQLAEKAVPPPPAASALPESRAVADAASAAAVSRNELTASRERDSTQSDERDSLARSARARNPSVSLSPEQITSRESERVKGEQRVQVGQAAGARSRALTAHAGPRRLDAVANDLTGCYLVEPGAAVTGAPVIQRVVLDSTAAGEWAGRPAWQVTVLSPATFSPVDFRWSLGTEGQVILVERRDGRNYSWMLDLPGSPRTAAGIAITRVDCPPR